MTQPLPDHPLDEISPDEARLLWMHVLRKAVEDYKYGNKARSKEAQKAYRDARRWLWSDRPDFPSFVALVG